MSYHDELNEQNEKYDDKVDDYEESEEPIFVVEEFLQFENQHKPNLDEN